MSALTEWLAHPRFVGVKLYRDSYAWVAVLAYSTPTGINWVHGEGDSPARAVSAAIDAQRHDPYTGEDPL